MLGLGLVIGLIFLLAWLVRRVQQAGPRGNRLIRTLASQPLGPRDRLVLVQVGEEQILLGLTPGRITPLHVLKEPVHLPDGEPATPEFAQRLLEPAEQGPQGQAMTPRISWPARSPRSAFCCWRRGRRWPPTRHRSRRSP